MESRKRKMPAATSSKIRVWKPWPRRVQLSKIFLPPSLISAAALRSVMIAPWSSWCTRVNACSPQVSAVRFGVCVSNSPGKIGLALPALRLLVELYFTEETEPGEESCHPVADGRTSVGWQGILSEFWLDLRRCRTVREGGDGAAAHPRCRAAGIA